MKRKFFNRALSLLLALVCIMGVLPLSAFAAEGLSSAPATITQKSSDYMKIGGQSVRYSAASSVINNVGRPYVFDEQVEVPGYGTTRALCAYQAGTLGPAANGQKWNFKNEVDNASLRVLLTCVYSHTYGDFTDAGNAVGLEHWSQYWSDIWFMVAQAASWLYEHGAILDVNSNREGFIEQMAEEFVAAMDNLQLEGSEYELIRYPQRGVCLYKCGNERYLLEVHAPEYKAKLFGKAGGR